MEQHEVVERQNGVEVEATLFPVEEYVIKHPITGDFTKHKQIINTETNDVISVMTTDYKLVPNATLFNEILKAVEKMGGILTHSYLYANGARTMWNFEFPDIKIELRSEDWVSPTIEVWNSYDGSMKVTFRYGAFRLVCSNGLTIGSSNAEKQLHLDSNDKLNDISNYVETMVENATTYIQEEFGIMIDTEFTMKDVGELVDLFPKKYQPEVTNRLVRDDSMNAWIVYNVCTEVTTHVMDRANESTKRLEAVIFNKVKQLTTNRF